MVEEDFSQFDGRFEIASANEIVRGDDCDSILPKIVLGFGELEKLFSATVLEIRAHDFVTRAVNKVPVVNAIGFCDVELVNGFLCLFTFRFLELAHQNEQPRETAFMQRTCLLYTSPSPRD